MRHFFLIFCLFLTGYSTFAQNNTAVSPKVISGTVLLNDKKAPDFKAIVKELPQGWYLRVDSLNVSEKTAVFSTSGATVMLAWLDYPINQEEIQLAAAISWLWKSAAKEATTHKSQLVISVLGDASKTIDLYRTFTKVAAGALSVCGMASGVYMNEEYLLLSKGYYIEAARNVSPDHLPLYCWIYFGILQQEKGCGGYTFGLSEFGLPEMEIVDSALPLQDAHALLYEVAQKAVADGTPWKDGQKISLSDGRSITVRLSKAAYIRDNISTLKIEK